MFILSLPTVAAPYTSKFSADFEQFSQSKRTSYTTFSKENEAQFAKSLKQDWQTFNQALINPMPAALKPRTQPIRKTESAGTQANQFKQKNEAQQPQPPTQGFYGHTISIAPITVPLQEYRRGNKGENKGENRQSIIEYRHYLTHHPDFETLIQNFEQLQKLHTHDQWAGLKLSEYLCGQRLKRPNSINLCSWVLMHNNQLDIRLAQAGDDLYLLTASEQNWLSSPYFEIAGKNLYITQPQKYKLQNSPALSIHFKAHPNAKYNMHIQPSIGLQPALKNIYRTRLINHGIKRIINLSINIDLDHFRYINALPILSISTYLHDRLPEYIENQLKANPYFAPANQTPTRYIEHLLNGLQYLPYSSDEEQFGQEKPMTFTQLLYFPASDCEDRVYALAALLQAFQPTQISALEYKGHLSAAVKIGQDWREADPTYKGANLGMRQSLYANEQPTWHD